jgi:REP element-mobilizing transposase RayT
MAYTKLFYHIIWSTQYREPTITPGIEGQLHGYLAKKAISLGGIVYALNGISDHVHLAASIPPSISLSKFIGQIKAVASVRINQSGLCDRKFYWQSSYSIFTFRESELPSIIRYIKNQKEHHKKGTIKPLLEKI